MAIKDTLRGAFGSLSDTLAIRFDPMFPPDVSSVWLAAMGQAATIAHRTADWNALVADSAAYDAVVAGLTDATHALVVANATPARMAALAETRAALNALAAPLDTPPAA